MSAPANDDFANAIDIGAYTTDIVPGQTYGNNIDATAQAGEPANQGKTVWYKFTTGAFLTREHQAIYISTLYNSTVGFLTPPLRTILHVYTGPDISHLTEVTYLPAANWTTNYAGWEFGSFVAFNLASGTTYYIRIDGVAGAEGLFPLSWDVYYALILGACDGCAPSFGVGYKCKGIITVTDINTPETTSFGVMPQGHYRIGYCGGVATDDDNSPKFWTLTGFADDGPFFSFFFDSGGGPNTGIVPLSNYPTEPGPPGASFKTPAECEYYNRCDTAEFDHFGGSDISLDFAVSLDGFTTLLPYRNPTFALYQLTPVLAFTTACASWVTHGVSATCNFNIHNFNDVAWDTITATLSATGGVSSPSAPQTGVTLAANSTGTLVFTFNASNPNVTATLTLDSPFFPAPVVLTIFLGPVIHVGANQSITGPGSCITKQWLLSIPITNTGFWEINPGATCSLSAGVKIFNPSTCAKVSSFDYPPGTLGCISGLGHSQPKVSAPSVATACVLTIVVADAEASYGTFTQNVTIPN